MQSDGRILRANSTLATWTGHAAADLIGRRFQDLLTVGTRLLYETSFAPQLSLNGACDEMSFDLNTVGGKPIGVSASGQVQKDAGGQSLSVRIVLFKAAERRRYERELVDARVQSLAQERATQGLLNSEREVSVLREQFIAVLGHDLRNPLAAMSGGLRLLQKAQSAERRQMLFTALESSVSRMANLINDVLDFARGRLGSGIPLELKPDVMLGPILEHVVDELRLGVPGREIESDIDLPKALRCDPLRISQLVSNLLSNALTHGSAARPVRIQATEDLGMLTIWVANAGDPIPPAALDRLFQPFFRGKVGSSQHGLGLGLHIAAEIAKAHAGTLVVVSTPEETRFTFQMPLAPS